MKTGISLDCQSKPFDYRFSPQIDIPTDMSDSVNRKQTTPSPGFQQVFGRIMTLTEAEPDNDG